MRDDETVRTRQEKNGREEREEGWNGSGGLEGGRGGIGKLSDVAGLMLTFSRKLEGPSAG
jgi:hypothetical protein